MDGGMDVDAVGEDFKRRIAPRRATVVKLFDGHAGCFDPRWATEVKLFNGNEF